MYIDNINFTLNTNTKGEMTGTDYKNAKGEKWSIEKGDWISYQNYEPKKKKVVSKSIDLSLLIIIFSLIFAITLFFTL